MPSDVLEDYLKAIRRLETEQSGPVSTSAIAARMDRTQPTVTSMLERLADEGLVDREKYAGVELTAAGERHALAVLRRHRLLETFLSDRLGYDPHEVHDEAEALEHHISEALEQRLAAALDHPTVDPHGDPIPTAALELTATPTSPLTECAPGDEVVVARLPDREPDARELLAEGLERGTAVELLEVTDDGTHVIASDVGTWRLPAAVAGAVRIHAGAPTPAGERA